MEQKSIYNNTLRYLLPLYDYNFILNDSVIEYMGAYSYCPHIPLLDKLIVLYKVKNSVEARNKTFPNLYLKQFFEKEDNLFMVIVLNQPDEYKYDWEHIINAEFGDISWKCKNRILNSSINKDNKKFISEIFCNFTNHSISQRSMNNMHIFGINEMLNW